MITIQEFVEAEILRLKNFQEYWEKMHLEVPDLFPTLLPEGEWLEHFDLYCQ
jgi:hypothetical protein